MGDQYRPMPRRELCYELGENALALTQEQSAIAWEILARRLMGMDEKDIPKFADVTLAINVSTQAAKMISQRAAKIMLDAKKDQSEKECPGPDCQMCSGEYCEIHMGDPCDCDVIDRHKIQTSIPR